MKIYEEVKHKWDIIPYEGKAAELYNELTETEFETIINALESKYPNGISTYEFNRLLEKGDTIVQILGYKDIEEFWKVI